MRLSYKNRYNTNITSTNIALKRKFGGKEYQDELGLDWYDITARNYDPALGRWMNVDPLADHPKQIGISPYAYCANNPVRYVDPTGMLFDDYGLDQEGNIELIKKTDDSTDTLYSVTRGEDGELVKDENGQVVKNDINGDGELGSSDSVTVSKNESDGSSILSQLAEPKTNHWGYKKLSVATTENMSEAFAVFKFGADNSNVEWALSGYLLDNGSTSFVLGTQHKTGSAFNSEFIGLKGGYRVENLLFDLHSHRKTQGGSGYKTIRPSLDRKRLINNNERAIKRGANSLPNYYIYHVGTRRLIQYTPTKGDNFVRKINESSDFYKN